MWVEEMMKVPGGPESHVWLSSSWMLLPLKHLTSEMTCLCKIEYTLIVSPPFYLLVDNYFGFGNSDASASSEDFSHTGLS